MTGGGSGGDDRQIIRLWDLRVFDVEMTKMLIVLVSRRSNDVRFEEKLIDYFEGDNVGHNDR